jgi:hypothetical protein
VAVAPLDPSQGCNWQDWIAGIVDVVGSHVITKTIASGTICFRHGQTEKVVMEQQTKKRSHCRIISSSAPLIQINADPNKSALFPSTERHGREVHNG